MYKERREGDSTGKFGLAVSLLEKFKPMHASPQPEFDADTTAALDGLRTGEPSELQIEVALSEIRSLRALLLGRERSIRRVEDEEGLAQHSMELEQAEAVLYDALVKLNPHRQRE